VSRTECALCVTRPKTPGLDICADCTTEMNPTELTKLRAVADAADIAQRTWFRNRSELETLEAMEALVTALAALETR
jgi:hypothetical protein